MVGVNWPHGTMADWAPGDHKNRHNGYPAEYNFLAKCEELATFWHLLDNILWDANMPLFLSC